MAKLYIFFLQSSISFLVSRFSILDSPFSFLFYFLFLFSLFFFLYFSTSIFSFLFFCLSFFLLLVKPTNKGGRPSNIFRHRLFSRSIVRVLQPTSLDADLSLKYVRITPHAHQDSVANVSRIPTIHVKKGTFSIRCRQK